MDDGTDAGRAAKAYCWTFGNAEFDESRWQLRVAGQDVELEHKPLEVLQYLLRHAGEAVTKDELLAEVWAGRIVVEAVLTNAVGKLRRALTDEAQDIVTTLPRVGYRLSVPVSRQAVEFVPHAGRLEVGDAVPRRPNWKLETALARTGGNEVWLARHAKTREARVFKFSLAGKGLAGLKREVTVARLLREALGERDDFVHVLDWDFEQAPYFIEAGYGGISLDRLDISNLSLERRLALYIQAADAVGAAHGVGVLHKDLKPANLLVHGEGDEARMRVADFGSSRLFDSGIIDELGITRLGLTQTQVMSSDSGTPLYLAPEVVAGQSATIKSDVYALGVTLYQLLVGDFRRPMSPGWESDIDDPLLRQDIADAANGDPRKRLESAEALAERIRNLASRREKHALELAVQARVAEGEKRLAKVRARRPWMMAAMVVLVTGLGTTGWYLQRSLAAERVAAEQRGTAEKQARRAEAVVKFLSNDLIRAVNPGGAAFEKEPTIRDLLEHASAHANERFPGDPAALGSLHAALGASWRSLGDRERSEQHLRQAVGSYTQAFGKTAEPTLRAKYDLIRTVAYLQRFDDAERMLEQTDKEAGRLLEGDNVLAFDSALDHVVVNVQQQNVGPAMAALMRADRLQRVLYASDVQLAATLRINLSDMLIRDGKSDKAGALLRETLADLRFDVRYIGETYLSALRLNLARVLRNQGRYAEALPLAEAAAAATEKLMGPNEYQTLVQLSTVANIHDRAGDCKKGLGIMRRVAAGMAANYGPDKQATIVEIGNLAAMEFDCGDREKALEQTRGVVATLRRQNGGDQNVHAQVFRYTLAGMLVKMGRHDEALQASDGLKAELLTAGDSTPGWQARLDALRGEILIATGKADEGRKLLAPAIETLVKLDVEETSELARLRGLLARG
ncbi:MAG: tetratricopeptide repeat protein [Thermomonas sp.]|nr:MAG: tetratricopeptide repeat protein [Thermomonas sp.]